MSHSPLRDLVSRLTPVKDDHDILGEWFALQVLDSARTDGAEAIAGSGLGLDHFAGERVLASVLQRSETGGHEHRLAAAITDRRTVLSGWSTVKGGFNDKRFSVPHLELAQVESKSSLLSNHVTLIGPAGRAELPFAQGIDQLAALFQAIAQLPYELRREPPTAFVTPSEMDPSGACGAIRGLWQDDAAAARLLVAVDQALRAGGLGCEAALDLTGRVVLAHRARAGGPGMHDGTWVSPLFAQELGHVLTHIFGMPLAESHPMPGWCCLDFAIDPQRDTLGMALDALGVAAYVGVGIGFSPVAVLTDRLMTRAPVTRLRVSFADGAGFSRYQLQAPPGLPLERVDSRMAHRLHLALGAWSYPMLERRLGSFMQAPAWAPPVATAP